MSDLPTLDDRLQSLLSLQGQELVQALIKELTQLNREIARLRRELDAVSVYQDAKRRWLAIDPQKLRTRLPVSVSIDATQLIPSRNGFYHLEQNKVGHAFRWTGPSPRFCFDIFVDRSNGADLDLRALACIDYERQKNIALMVDGQDVPMTSERIGGSGLRFTAILPPSSESAATHLDFVVPEVMVPVGARTQRLLGIAFSSLSVTARDTSGTVPLSHAQGEEPAALDPATREKETEKLPSTISPDAAAS